MLFFATALPISIQGMGPTQAVAVYFFKSYVTATTVQDQETSVLAYSLAIVSISILMQGVLGVLFLPTARRLGMPENPEAEAEAEAEAEIAVPSERPAPQSEVV